MKLNESQLRLMIKQAINEATVDPVDAITQVQNAVKVLIKHGPVVAAELSKAAETTYEDDSMFGASHVLDTSAHVLENLPEEFKLMTDMLRTYNHVMKKAGLTSKSDQATEEVPGRGMRNLSGGPPKPGMTRSVRSAWQRGKR